jgi:AAA ATPase domain
LEHIKTLTVDGLRGVSGELPLNLAIPDGRPGSGLTILVGANNSGKSTVVEAFDALAKTQQLPSFSIGKRNAYNPNLLRIYCTFVGDEQKQNFLELVYGGSETRWVKHDVAEVDISVVPSRRGFAPYFGRINPLERQWYYGVRQTPRQRGQMLEQYAVGCDCCGWHAL